jgi:hypothetical protein
MGIDAAAFLPYDASFAGFVPRYVKWLHDRERLGWRWLSGESETRRRRPSWRAWSCTATSIASIAATGKDGATIELIDYKTGSAEKLKEKVREPLEDTQLAFYAALVGDEVPVTASYLAVDRTRGLIQIAHHRVADDARTLVAGIADEMSACARAPACARSARAARATTAGRAACAGAITGRATTMARDAPALRVDGRRVDRRPSTPPRATRRARASSRRAPARARPGCWSRACCARCSTARRRTRSWRSPSRAPRRARCASGSTPGLPISRRRARRTSSACARSSTAASTRRARKRSRPELGALQGRVLAAGRAVEIRTFHGWFAQLLRSAPLALLDGLGVQADAELVEDWSEHRAAVHRTFHAALLRDEALRADHAAVTAARAGTSFASGSTQSGTGASSSSSPTRRACSRRASSGRGRLARARGLRASRRVDRDRRVDRSPARRGSRARLGARQAGARRGRELAAALFLAPRERFAAAWSTLFTIDDTPRAFAKGLAARRAGAGRAPAPGDQVHQHESREEHLRMVRLGRALLAALADYKRRKASPTWPTSSASRSSCCATASCRAGSRSGSTRASPTC